VPAAGSIANSTTTKFPRATPAAGTVNAIVVLAAVLTVVSMFLMKTM
jgi:hypothetical protein